MEEAKYAPLATDTEVNNYFSIYKNSEIIDPKMMIFNSLIAADDNDNDKYKYNSGDINKTRVVYKRCISKRLTPHLSAPINFN